MTTYVRQSTRLQRPDRFLSQSNAAASMFTQPLRLRLPFEPSDFEFTDLAAIRSRVSPPCAMGLHVKGA